MVNQGTVLGRVGKIDTKTTSTGTKITNISIVTSKKFVKNGEKQEKATWHNVTAFSKVAEIAEKYVNVGDCLYIQGEMDNQKYTTQDGQERTKHFIVAHTLQLMPKTKEHGAAPKDKSYEAGFEDDDIPW
ncbi:single-stranded DNA-binding protein [Legionella maceachernii]|uniref:Single-stranded DNA-binding protein n=1 Tax=Legionella maceachernii TaxID=466 RepID=A0A0W0WBB9_9GAMM|nr:single-stranded DNA-binding protein [Legionella maceachernii]KTD29655.1 Single-strand binding protein (SSB) (Helix-destabilizing protein) [Legionella maceachernii]SKA20850.1 single-strand DNA-binding protein [Legionella maceachernii]SUP02637.1 Helix-destabilizing protein [Legionella maceachernii]